ncbi:hypothetical protein AXX12_03000 [Anaerosporomusa subterranea]|jgi:hypothetical protein|uniref:Cation/H+ exchanger domain-containing protein n=1 Tax=Anaerosporomusa subterranea TaxID=1794912 RepID=A0A154BT90_ANASB|nr:hypothetical protein [Anaerosporomusa subterranea]KYZ77117.1 hypothetical protein AXX12_03000 [Anaerosporomusa subterranea]MDF2500739.1 hypothetical protein [Anaerosporomusa subterranea]
MHFWALIILLIILIGGSIWMRMCCLRAVDSSKVQQTVFSIAVQELVATAGGVYLSIIALVSFLKLDIPEKLAVAGISFDPIALLAIGVAVAQPLWRRLFPENTE